MMQQNYAEGAVPLQGRVLICVDCTEEFVFTAKAQQYFLERGYTEDPRRCKACHEKFRRQKRTQ